MKRLHVLATAALTLPVLASPAMAHTGPGASGLGAGLAHPIIGIDHLLAILAVGLWSASQTKGKAWQGPATFVILMTVGCALGLAGIAMPLVEAGILASVVVFGLMILARHTTQALGLIAIGGFAMFHGHAHGSEAIAGAVTAYMAGFLISTVALHACGYVAGRAAARWHHGMQVAGAAVALSGLALIAG